MVAISFLIVLLQGYCIPACPAPEREVRASECRPSERRNTLSDSRVQDRAQIQPNSAQSANHSSTIFAHWDMGLRVPTKPASSAWAKGQTILNCRQRKEFFVRETAIVDRVVDSMRNDPVGRRETRGSLPAETSLVSCRTPASLESRLWRLWSAKTRSIAG